MDRLQNGTIYGVIKKLFDDTPKFVYDEKIEILFLDMMEYSYQAKTNERTNEMESTTVTTMSPAVRAAALKRERAAAAKLARVAGKAAAAEKRAAVEAAWSDGVRNGREAIATTVQAVRKAMGVRKNEPNPSSIVAMKERLEMEMMIALRNKILE